MSLSRDQNEVTALMLTHRGVVVVGVVVDVVVMKELVLKNAWLG